AIQVRDDDERIRTLAASLNDLPTMRAVRAERAFVQALEDGGQVPIAALAVPTHDGALLHGMIADVAGTRVVRGTIALDVNEPELSGVRLGNQLRGGRAGGLST